jgi:Lipase (class 3)
MSTRFNPCNVPLDTYTALFLIRDASNYQHLGLSPVNTPNLLDGIQSLRVNQAAGTLPAWLLVDRGDEIDVVIAGTFSTGSFQAQVASASAPMTASGAWSTGQVHTTDAAVISSTVSQSAKGRSPRVVLVGHSYGGVLAEVAAAQLLDARADLQLSVTTFGSPRAGAPSLAGRLAPLSLLRVMNDNDPIPYFPPHFYEALAMVLATGPVPAAFWSAWVQPGGGIVLRPDGSFFASALPPLGAPIADVNLLAWVTGANGELSAAHSITQYGARLKSTLAALPTTTTPWPVPRGAEGGQPVSVADATDFVNSGGQVVRQSLLGGSSVMAYIPVNFRARAKYSAPFFWVTWNGFVVSNHTTKSSARTHAKYINKWLRVMQTAKNVSQGSLNSAIAAYLAAAPQAGLGFIPPLTVNP